VPQFVTEVDGQPVHFLHARSPEPGALPLVITHGYPGSVVEFLDAIGPLTDRGPTRRPGRRVPRGRPLPARLRLLDAGPGAGMGDDPDGQGWAELMARLGYERYGAQGGDIGRRDHGMLASLDPGHVVGVHLNRRPSGRLPPSPSRRDQADAGGRTAEHRAQPGADAPVPGDGLGYLQLQTTRPQTVAYALTDSPAAQLAWIAEKFKEGTDPRPTCRRTPSTATSC
jgi:hypothetical protein